MTVIPKIHCVNCGDKFNNADHIVCNACGKVYEHEVAKPIPWYEAEVTFNVDKGDRIMKTECELCGQDYKYSNDLEVRSGLAVCPDCLEKHFTWCENSCMWVPKP